jgi:tRNA threonylcarbamoyladenosine biosynthesis protein TsaB
MQEKINYSIIAQCTYDVIHIALFDGNTLIALRAEDKKESSKTLLVALDKLLSSNGLSIKNISYIAASEGPAPFTTLRVLIATINGVAFASKIPLVGLNSLLILTEEHRSKTMPTLCLFNAFHNDAYYALAQPGHEQVTVGCKPIATIIEELKTNYSEQEILFIGQGAEVFGQQIFETLGDKAIFIKPLPAYPSMQHLHKHAALNFKNKQTKEQLSPLYLKTIAYKKVS